MTSGTPSERVTRIGNESDARFVFVGILALNVFKTLQNFRADGGGKTSVQRVAQLGLVADQALRARAAHAGRSPSLATFTPVAA